MKRTHVAGMAAFAVAAILTADFADARRLGGGRSLGAQRQSIAPAKAPPPAATPAPNTPAGAASNPVMAGQPAAGAAAAGRSAAPAASGASRWLGPVAGLAAGLGLAALAAHLGLSEALMSVLMIALVAIVAIALLRFLFARRTPAPRTTMPYAGAGAGLGGRAGGYETQAPPAPVTSTFEPVFGAPRKEPSLTPSPEWSKPAPPRFPAGFDPEPFLRQASVQFNRLQAAYSAGDRATLAEVMTPELFADIALELETHPNPSSTEIVALDPEMVDVTTENGQHWASVRFRGLLREAGETLPKPIDEMWNLVKPVDGSSGWLLAGIRQIDEAPVGHA